jgi:hypothetical protein
MLPLAKLWSRWWIHIFEACSNQTEIIATRCVAIYSILMGEPIQVGRMIVQSIKHMISSSDTSVGHPFVITHLCSLAGVPGEDDHITGPLEPLGARFLARAQRDLDRVMAPSRGNISSHHSSNSRYTSCHPSSTSSQILSWG